MPVRKTPLATDEIYHIVDRGVASSPIFHTRYDYRRFLNAFCYYRFNNTPVKFSKFLELSKEKRLKILTKLEDMQDYLIETISYCLMPNHFHFLLRQQVEGGITKFIRLLENSYSHYFNLKYNRKGGLYEGRFRSVIIETNAQLLHVARYIHLNPYSSYVVKDLNLLLNYPYSSLPEYLGKVKKDFCNKKIILGQFKNLESFKDFIANQADYQRSLEIIKHQLLEA
jgi:putative transposase